MSKGSAQLLIESLLAQADIRIGGGRPWDIEVLDSRFYFRVIRGGSLALGEAYMDGWWECERLDDFFARALKAKLHKKIGFSFPFILEFCKSVLFNLQSSSRAFQVGERHYDVGNDLYEAMLDKRMVYTCGYWKSAKTLEKAQEDKLDLVCRKIGLKPGEEVLDIGCGWGSFLQFAAEKYGAKGVGLTVSREQARLARERLEKLPLEVRPEVRLQDYRENTQAFDKVISLGMFEHVGYKNYRTYMEMAHLSLRDQGLFLLHTIGANVSRKSVDPWIGKYIFPNGLLPSAAQIARAAEGLFVIEDWHNFGADYDKTLLAWHDNFVKHWPILKEKYSERFFRMWRYYLLQCAGAFRAREIQLWQIVLSKDGVPGGYKSVR